MARFPSGVGRIARGECPLGNVLPLACMLCECGHMLECHYPQTCEEAQCEHWQEAIQQEADPLEGFNEGRER